MAFHETEGGAEPRGRPRMRPESDAQRSTRDQRALQRREPLEQQIQGILRWIGIAALAALTAPRGLKGLFGRRRRGLFLGSARSTPGGALAAAALGGAAVALLDRRKGKRRAGPLVVQRSITIGKSAQELHQMLREPDTLSRIMGRVAEIEPAGDTRMHWVVRGPGERRLEWDQRLVEDRPGEFLRWESVPGAALHNAFSVRFRPAPRDWGTEVTLRLRVDLAGHPLAAIAKHLGPVPGGLASKALHRFKSLAETGEVPTLACQPAARNGGRDI